MSDTSCRSWRICCLEGEVLSIRMPLGTIDHCIEAFFRMSEDIKGTRKGSLAPTGTKCRSRVEESGRKKIEKGRLPEGNQGGAALCLVRPRGTEWAELLASRSLAVEERQG